ncbi:hypothetical protein NM688_g7386 [Phlebia brevispora]|uniref:Uncharacterized protein n=1 Tax=Phlebia brevispora TaxID=194682 RepID=A0ACC1S5R0_9APHY|nr:hypothetical protein NM688_g7386 [Phlebia brevispora]
METFDESYNCSFMDEPMPQVAPRRSPSPPSARRERVPQTLEIVSPDRHFKVNFSVNGVPGIPVVEAMSESVELDGGDDKPFTSNGSRQIRLVIKWPGYSDNKGWYIPVKERISATEETYITRKHFAAQVSERVKRFVKMNAKRQIRDSCKEWTLGNEPGAIKLEDLWLVSVTRASNNIYVAELEVQRS